MKLKRFFAKPHKPDFEPEMAETLVRPYTMMSINLLVSFQATFLAAIFHRGFIDRVAYLFFLGGGVHQSCIAGVSNYKSFLTSPLLHQLRQHFSAVDTDSSLLQLAVCDWRTTRAVSGSTGQRKMIHNSVPRCLQNIWTYIWNQRKMLHSMVHISSRSGTATLYCSLGGSGNPNLASTFIVR